MSKRVLPSSPNAESTSVEEVESLVEAARQFQRKACSENTMRGYRSDFADFKEWCLKNHRDPLPAHPDTVALYLTKLSYTKKISTIRRRMASITQAHRLSGLESPIKAPTVRLVWQGILRTKPSAQKHAPPTLLGHIKSMLASTPDSLAGVRDRALILIGFAGGLRRSELVQLEIEDLAIGEEGLILRIKRSKTDPEGRGRTIGIPYGQHEETCPINALEAWLHQAQLTSGPIFRGINKHRQISHTALTGKAVSLIVKRAITAAGLTGSDFSAHSLRSGFATSAAIAGASERDIQKQTGHKSLEVLRRYIQDGNLFRNNAVRKIGL